MRERPRPKTSNDKMTGALRCLLTAILLVAAAGCARQIDGTAPASAAAPAAPPSFAIAPVTGAPADASARLVELISDAAADQGLPVIAGDQATGAAYVLEGITSTRQTPQGTAIAFAWDLSDANGIRQLRVVDTQFVASPSPDAAWEAENHAALSRAAEQVAVELAGFYGAPAAPAANTVAQGSAAPATTARQSSPVHLTGPVKVHVRDVAGEPKASRPVLERALRAALLAEGAHLVVAPEPGAVLVSGSMVVRPSSAGGDMVTLQWDVARPNGAAVGSIVQERLFGTGRLTGAWSTAGSEAADDAARAILVLLSPNRDTAPVTAPPLQLRGFTAPDTN